MKLVEAAKAKKRDAPQTLVDMCPLASSSPVVLSDSLWTADLQNSVFLSLYLFSCCCDQIPDTKRLKEVLILVYGFKKRWSMGTGKT